MQTQYRQKRLIFVDALLITGLTGRPCTLGEKLMAVTSGNISLDPGAAISMTSELANRNNIIC